MLKACTGKFTPIQQFYYYAAPEILKEGPETDLGDYAPTTTSAASAPASASSSSGAAVNPARYDHQIAVVGRSTHTKITQMRYFLVGAGAIGCEMLKIWALVCAAAL